MPELIILTILQAGMYSVTQFYSERTDPVTAAAVTEEVQRLQGNQGLL